MHSYIHVCVFFGLICNVIFIHSHMCLQCNLKDCLSKRSYRSGGHSPPKPWPASRHPCKILSQLAFTSTNVAEGSPHIVFLITYQRHLHKNCAAFLEAFYIKTLPSYSLAGLHCSLWLIPQCSQHLSSNQLGSYMHRQPFCYSYSIALSQT